MRAFDLDCGVAAQCMQGPEVLDAVRRVSRVLHAEIQHTAPRFDGHEGLVERRDRVLSSNGRQKHGHRLEPGARGNEGGGVDANWLSEGDSAVMQRAARWHIVIPGHSGAARAVVYAAGWTLSVKGDGRRGSMAIAANGHWRC
jgi:hypothetical protein